MGMEMAKNRGVKRTGRPRNNNRQSVRERIIQAGELFNQSTRGQDNFFRQSIGDVIGGQRFREGLKQQSHLTRQRGRKIELEQSARRAIQEFDELRGKNRFLLFEPPAFTHKQIKITILNAVRNGEIRSFDDLREFLKENQISHKEQQFGLLMDQLFKKEELKLFLRVFGEEKLEQNFAIWQKPRRAAA